MGAGESPQQKSLFIYLFVDGVTFSPPDISESFSRSLIDAINVSGPNTVQDLQRCFRFNEERTDSPRVCTERRESVLY